MSFSLGARSRRHLEGVHPAIVAVVGRAILITMQDFAVHDGVRTLEEQQAHVPKAVTQSSHRQRH